MTHLYIELNTGLTEEVNNKTIEKLYKTVTENTLDETSGLKGRLHTASARDTHIKYLTTRFPELYITADTLYITFADPYIERYMRNYIGDGTGTVLAHILSFISSGKAFGESYNSPYLGNNRTWALTYNLKILPTTFNEFGTLFEGITKVSGFNEFRNLTSITLPSTVTTLYDNAFRNTFALTSINNLENIEYLGGCAFSNSHIGGDLSFPNLTYIGAEAFSNCANITSISFSAITELKGDAIFNKCSNLTQVTGLSTITNCKASTFSSCSNLETVDIDFSIVTGIGNNTFEGCQKLNLGNLVLPSLTGLSSWCFQNCKKLYSVDLSSSSSITALNNGVFSGCSNLTTAVLPASCTTFDGRETFLNCSSLTSINTGNITKFGSNTFLNCTSLLSVDFSSATHVGDRCFSQSGITGQISIPNYSGTLGNYAFYGTPITSISLSSNCTKIGDSAFWHCTSLLTISNISNVATIGREAFSGCSNLDITDWDLSSVTSLGQYAFYGCSNLKGTLNLSGVLTINALYTELFSGCSSLTKIILGSPGTIGASYNNASRSMFEECNSLKVIDITLLDTISICNNCIIKSNVFEALIIRNSTTVPAVEKQQNYSGAMRFDKIIQNSNARIYVPRAMLSTYTNDPEWSAISSYILAVEDYTPSV